MSRSPKLHDSPKIRRINSAATNGLSRSGLNRSGGDISLSDSLRRIALQQAVADSDEFTELTRSISGRLGYRGLNSSNATPVPEGLELPNEGTRLLDSPGLTIDSLSVEEVDHPPLRRWIFPALSCAAAYAFYNIFIKKGSATINPILGGVILQFVAALLGTGLLAFLMCTSDKTFELHYDKHGIFWACMAGLAVGMAEMLSFVVSGLGVPATQSIPIIIGGSVMFGAVLGLVILGEHLMLHGWSGIGLLVTGIVFVALDPGEKVEEGGGDVEVNTGGGAPAYWVIIALICANAYAFYNIFIKKGSASINPILGGVVLQFVAAAFGSVLLGVIVFMNGTSSLKYDHAGLLWSCAAGIAVGTAEMLSFCVSGMGVNATQSIPIIIGGSVLFGAVLGLLILGETMLWPGWVGVALLTTGIGFVATDPGEKVAGH